MPPDEPSDASAAPPCHCPGLSQLQAGELRNINFDHVQMQITMHQEASLIVGTLRDAMRTSAADMRGFLSDTLTTIGDHRRTRRPCCAIFREPTSTSAVRVTPR